MKKFISIAAALAMLAATAVSVSAAEITPTSEENASTSVIHSYNSI